MTIFDTLKQKVETLKRDTYALYLAYRDPRTPWYAKAWLALVLGYLASPIDLIPDFIPVLGYLDDLLLVPAGLALAVKLIPQEVLYECRVRARNELRKGPRKNWAVAILVIAIWFSLLCFIVWWLWRVLKK